MYRGLRFCSSVIIAVGMLASLPLFFLGVTSLFSAVSAVASPAPIPEELANLNLDATTIQALSGGVSMAMAGVFIVAGLLSFALASFAGFGGLALADIAENSRKTLLAIQTA